MKLTLRDDFRICRQPGNFARHHIAHQTSLSKSIDRRPPRHINNPSELMFFAQSSGQ
jgi:hypothetical protein